jgi:hypothetical protein
VHIYCAAVFIHIYILPLECMRDCSYACMCGCWRELVVAWVCVCVCVCETHTHTHTHQIYEIASTHKHGIIELSACRAQPPPDEGGQPQQGSSTNRYTGCVDNNPIQNTHTHTTNRHRQQQHMRASHTIICIYLCVLGHKITIHNLRPCHRRRRW